MTITLKLPNKTKSEIRMMFLRKVLAKKNFVNLFLEKRQPLVIKNSELQNMSATYPDLQNMSATYPDLQNMSGTYPYFSHCYQHSPK